MTLKLSNTKSKRLLLFFGGHAGHHHRLVQTAGGQVLPLFDQKSPAWEWFWAGLILLIGMQLLLYSE